VGAAGCARHGRRPRVPRRPTPPDGARRRPVRPVLAAFGLAPSRERCRINVSRGTTGVSSSSSGISPARRGSKVSMGRPELPLDPDSGRVQSFAYDLRRLRQEAGSPSYRDLAQRARYSVSVLSRAASGRELPSLAVTRAYVDACGGNTEQWRDRWQQVTAELRAQPAADGTPASASQVTGPPADPARPGTGRRRDLPRRLSTAVGLAAVLTWLLWQQRRPGV
jgi:Helix-turn-helix domain